MGNSKHQNVDFDKLKLGEATGLTLDPQNSVKSSQPKEIRRQNVALQWPKRTCGCAMESTVQHHWLNLLMYDVGGMTVSQKLVFNGIFRYVLIPINVIFHFTGWWFGTFGLFFHILGMIIPTDGLIFFRWVGIPPTSLMVISDLGLG